MSFRPVWMFVYFSFFGWFGGGCIGIVYLGLLYWRLFFNRSFSLPIKKKMEDKGMGRVVSIKLE